MDPHHPIALPCAARQRGAWCWRAAAVLLGAVLTPELPASTVPASDRAALVHLGSSVLKIEVPRRQGGYSLGSGVVVAPERVVTNCHVTRDARAIVVLMGGQRFAAQAQAADSRHDLCLLQVAGVDRAPVPLAPADHLRTGQPVKAIGYTGGLGLNASDGEVVALHRLDDGPVIQSTNWFTSGSSGGGLFDERLRLVGILTFRLRGGEAHYFSAPSEWVQRLLAADTVFEPVRPLDADALAYWERPGSEQPPFLQAESLTRSSRWADLKVLAARWQDDDFSNPLPSYARGVAEEGLGQTRAAFDAYIAAVSRDREFARGWLRLGLVSLDLGLTEQAGRALATLRDLGSDLAAELAPRLNPD